MTGDLSNKADSDLCNISARTLKKRRLSQPVIVTPIQLNRRETSQRREGILELKGNTLVVRSGYNNVSYLTPLKDEVSWYDGEMRCIRYRYLG